MGVIQSDYIDVSKKAMELDCNIPTGVAILPRNFDKAQNKQDLLHEACVPTLRTLFRRVNVKETKLEKEDERFSYIEERDYSWVSPTIYISSLIVMQNQEVITAILKVLSDYAVEYVKGLPKHLSHNDKIKINIVKEVSGTGSQKRTFKKIDYEGSIEGIDEVKKLLREV